MDYRVKLVSVLGSSDSGIHPGVRHQVEFDNTPQFSEEGSVQYQELNPIHTPGGVQIYRNTPSRHFTIAAKLYSNTGAEAAANMQRLQLLRAWRYPFFGRGSATLGTGGARPLGDSAGGMNLGGVTETSVGTLVGSSPTELIGAKKESILGQTSMLSNIQPNASRLQSAIGSASSVVKAGTTQLTAGYAAPSSMSSSIASPLGSIYGPAASLSSASIPGSGFLPELGSVEAAKNAAVVSNTGDVFTKEQFVKGGSEVELLGAPPEVLYLYAYAGDASIRSQSWVNIHRVPVVITNLSITYPDDVDYIPTSLGPEPFPVRIEVSITLAETHSPMEYENFSLMDFKMGKLEYF